MTLWTTVLYNAAARKTSGEIVKLPIDHSFIGKEYPSVTYEMGREKIREYANAVGDANPLYLDEEFGRASAYGDTIAPPAMASQYSLLVAGDLIGDPDLNIDFPMLLHYEQDYEYFNPVRPGDRLTVRGRIKDIYERRTLQLVVFETEVTNQRGEKVTVATSTFLIRPREEAKA